MDIGVRLRALRDSKKLTAKQLSASSGVPEKTIYRIERGEVSDPKLSTITKLINSLSCTANDLLMDESKSGLEGRLKLSFEKAKSLSPRDKGTLINVIDRFCMASNFIYSYDKSSDPERENDEVLLSLAIDAEHGREIEEQVRKEEPYSEPSEFFNPARPDNS